MLLNKLIVKKLKKKILTSNNKNINILITSN